MLLNHFYIAVGVAYDFNVIERTARLAFLSDIMSFLFLFLRVFAFITVYTISL